MVRPNKGRDESVPFDFDWEATTAASNEACEGNDPTCNWNNLCIHCKALKVQIEMRLRKAFLAGKLSCVTSLPDIKDDEPEVI